VYEKDGEKYFIVDSHMHYWDATPQNWVAGQEKFAKGWIECFHAYQGLGPPDTHWSIEHFQKYSEDDLMKDVFEDGYVDVAIFQPTYLKEWYKEGFNTTERNALMGEKHPGKFVYNTRWDPRDGDDGLDVLKRNVERFGSTGCKLYTAECLERIGGVPAVLGWDTIDGMYARMHGFRTRSFSDVVARHHRPTGAAAGLLRARARHGACASSSIAARRTGRTNTRS